MTNKLLAFLKFLLLLSFLLILLNTCKKEGDNDPETTGLAKFTITPEGGEYIFKNGIKLNVPAGAVTEETEIEISIVDSTNTQLQSIFINRGESMSSLIACIEAKPDGLSFNAPVKLTIPVEFEKGILPFVYDVDFENGTYTPVVATVVTNPEAGNIELSISHFCAKSIQKTAEDKYGEEQCAKEPCKCMDGNTFEQEDRDVICDKEGCQAVQTKTKATYPGCDNLVEMYIAYELSDKCVPQLILSADKTTISPEESCEITIKVELACDGLPTQDVTYSVSSLGILSSLTGTTGGDGKTSVTFTAGKNPGKATITVKAKVIYHDSFTYIVGKEDEKNPGKEIIKNLTKTIDITIEGEEKWKGNYSFQLIYNLGEEKYSGPFNFTLSKKQIYGTDTFRIINGTSITSFEITAESGHPDIWYENFQIPSNITLYLEGYANDFVHMQIGSRQFGETEYFITYTFDGCMINSDGVKECSLFENITALHLGQPWNSDSLAIPLKEGTYSNEYKYYEGNYSYTITLERDE
ncbi:MAG: hypothetical protein JXB17_09345 [Bacteroidales bacterium]|nr:hypothetical protein [Bacteroidales bacterium]